MIKLPNNREDWNWHQWLTFKCNFACDYCIMGERQLGGGTPKYKPKEMTGKEIVEFWNNVEHPPLKKLSIIGGEPTVHKDFSYVINNLEGYYITVTSNCGSRYFNNDNFVENLKTKPSSHLRMNTSFHPDFITPEGYVRVVKLMKEAGLHVDQTAFVLTPEFEKHRKKLEKVASQVGLRPDVFLGFWNEEDGFEAPFEPENAWPNNTLPAQFKAHTGIYNMDVYRQACMQPEKYQAPCDIVYNNMLVDPSGMVYHCHYKMYNEIDPVCHISDFKPITPKDKICKHYGFCLSCDAPHVQKEVGSKAVKLNKLFDKTEFSEREIVHLSERLKTTAAADSLYYNEKVLFESVYMYLYSGHKHSSRVAFYGREDHSLLKYLTSKKYKITNCNDPDIKSIWKHDIALLTDLKMSPDEILSLSKKISNIMSPNGILMISLDVGTDNILSKDVLIEGVLNPLLESGFIIQGGPESVDEKLFDPEVEEIEQKYLPDNSRHAYAMICLRKDGVSK